MTTQKILQQTFRNHNGIRKQSLKWTLMSLLVLLQVNSFDAAKYKGDSCESKSKPGICKEWSECPEIKALINSGKYTNREVVTCGFGVKEELICCPLPSDDNKTGNKKNIDNDRLVIQFRPETTTTPLPERDFWLDLLENLNNTSTTTEAATDFWQDSLTTTTSTNRPLMVGELRLNESSEFFDLNALLSGTHKRQTNPVRLHAQNTDFAGANAQNVGFIRPGNNNKNNNWGANLNSRPVNINQWNLEQSSNNRRGNNGRGHLNNGSNGRGPQNSFKGNISNNGRDNNSGQQNNGRRGINNGNGVRGSKNENESNRNLGNSDFVYPENNNRPNAINDFNNGNNFSPNRPVNNMNEQNPNMPSTNTNDVKHLDKLIKDVFDTTSGNFQNLTEQNISGEQNLDTLLTNIFDTPTTKHTQHRLRFPDQNAKNPETHGVPKNQVDYINSHHQNAPIRDYNEFETEPSTNFIRQPVVVETWPHNPAHTPEFDPIQKVYQNLVKSGMDIVKIEADRVQNSWNQQQQQFENHIPQFRQFMQQPSQQFVQQPNANHFGQQQFVQQLQSSQPMPSQFGEKPLQREEQLSKASRSVQQPSFGKSPNVQSAPTTILDPFKPFEFRPSPEDEVNNSLSPNQKSTVKPNTDRPAVRACRRIEKDLVAGLSNHILDGIPVELGELPHMAGIGYSRIGGENKPPYDILCGGTLIHKRFVLTAAHCVSDRLNIPSIVRLGVVNNTAGEHMKNAVELKIKQTFIHDDYSTSKSYNDIAILEMESEVQTNNFIYPVCLHSDTSDPDTNIKLWVSGWGTINRTTRSFSNILLKAPLHTAPLEECNESYVEYGLTRQISDGIRRTQICATDKDQLKDSCQGDSGGPLQLIVDETLKNYRLVGVVSTGFSCGSSTPGLYTRVAAFLDFIEQIVWPNGGD